jgi:hypothetical protein
LTLRITSDKPTFYEQVTAVNISFSLIRVLSFFCWLLRILLSTEFLFALWMSCLDASSVPVGVREESRCCHLSDGLYGQSRLAVIGTRCRRNGLNPKENSSGMDSPGTMELWNSLKPFTVILHTLLPGSPHMSFVLYPR